MICEAQKSGCWSCARAATGCRPKDAAFIAWYWGKNQGFYVFVFTAPSARGGHIIGRSKDAAVAARMVACGFLGCESVWDLYVPEGTKFRDIPIYE